MDLTTGTKVRKPRPPPVNANCFEDFPGDHSFEDPAVAAFAKKPPPWRGGEVNRGELSLVFSESYSQVYRR
ncbi:hypothetical protein SBA2_430029 [Acidobacteriia bacterium SbA2]|nr:hypothetical protein SBA2_430029 [Acidobacteriia bacterium SbA2]